MTDGDGLMNAILAEPDEDTPRLAFADLLDEHGGEANAARAEFIRTQIALARTPERDVVPWNPRVVALRAREKALLAVRSAEWVAALRGAGGPLDGVMTGVQFRRGFVELAWMPAGWFVEHAGELFRRVPLRELRVTGVTPDSFAALLASPHLGRLDTLDLSARSLADAGAAQLAACRPVTRLRGLRLRASDVTDVGAYRLADVEFEWRPRELDVSLNPVGPAGLAALRGRYGPGVVRFDAR
jgi:uncharacterized protein (TIGR02996 family)